MLDPCLWLLMYFSSSQLHSHHIWVVEEGCNANGCGFDPQPGQTKHCKNVTNCLPSWHLVFSMLELVA